MLFTIFQYGFALRALEAGVMVALIAPVIGIFLVLRRYSLIADTLAHVSLAGIAVGILAGINPVITALVAAILASLGIERLRAAKKVHGESALALFLSGSLALAVVLLSAGRGLNANLLSYLFGSIVTVSTSDIAVIFGLGVLVLGAIAAFSKELVFISFDEEAARVSGIPVRAINTLLIILTALTVSLSIPIVGVLLIASLLVIPAVTALQFKKSFIRTILYAEIISLGSVVSGIFASFYFNIPAGGTIVLVMLAVFLAVLGIKIPRDKAPRY